MRQDVVIKTGALLFEQLTRSAEETRQVAADFAGRLQGGDIVCISGELGTGKTTFIQGICRALGVKDAVTSPTFTLINEYSGRLRIFHFDFYRIDSEKEALDLGIEDYFYSDGVCLLEWPERVFGLLPAKFYLIQLEWNPELEANSRLIKAFRQE
ncbi:MAG: tRNA (adenosine(37)-N6)-threonylcarbamoyltransferase complex ATPase subunit type 1 TsaE [candidate division KSB1 bacterium]|nr:tRNA (adenosine(37)-N6)-threonylcarbamoyltransferase complex ATPase subunit type 1 TsaE [candidate division KSB1 bacterium]